VSNPKKVEAKADKPANWQPPATEAAKPAESKDKPVFTVEDKAALEKQEGVIASNIGAFLLIGEALSIIKERDLYKITEPTLDFDAYCAKKWGFGEKYAYRLIKSYKCVKHLKEQLGDHGVTLYPTNEAQVRDLAGLKPEEQVKTWSAVLKKANGGGITAALVEEVLTGKGAKASKSEATAETKTADAKTEHKKLKTIARLVEKAKQIDAEELNFKKFKELLDKIEELLNDDEVGWSSRRERRCSPRACCCKRGWPRRWSSRGHRLEAWRKPLRPPPPRPPRPSP